MKKELSVILVILIIAAFFARVGSFEREHPLTFDEIVYSNLAMQMMEPPLTYNTRAIYRNALKKGRPLPAYFDRPLFKHPPMYPFMVSLSYRMFGADYSSAFKVSLAAGLILIVLAYLLAGILFDSRTAVLAAALMTIEPVAWICSQKIWTETTLAMFSVLSLYFFALYLRKDRPAMILAAGFSSGLAVLTKYPGILPVAAMGSYALLWRRDLFRKKAFIAGIILPFLMLLPWIQWNYSVYGSGSGGSIEEISHLARVVSGLLSRYGLWAAAAAAAAVLIYLLRHRIKLPEAPAARRTLLFAPLLIAACILIFFVRDSWINALNLLHVPQSGWKIGMFAAEPWHFYIGRLAELSPFYIFPVLGVILFVLDAERGGAYRLLYLYAGLILLFYMVWGNYQSRYITAVTVSLMILSARLMLYVYDGIGRIVPVRYRTGVRILMMLIAGYCLLKTLRVDLLLAVPNKACYF
ncbi:MAG: phospholipid carrier-dependent glycosyltransferase [Candidatus Omnitrophica bacterium]|nr:phospholipid carrier-dependent glycosyltransferase [Candidatus Omnitrophota bacterium]